MAITLEGTVYSVSETRTISEKFQLREMILTVDPSAQRPAYIPLQVINNNVDLFDGLTIGDKIKVDCNLNGNLSKDGQKAYASFTVTSLSHAGSVAPSAAKAPSQTGYAIEDIDPDDLNF